MALLHSDCINGLDHSSETMQSIGWKLEENVDLHDYSSENLFIASLYFIVCTLHNNNIIIMLQVCRNDVNMMLG